MKLSDDYIDYRIPAHYLGVIFNGDTSGLNDDEEQEITEFLDSLSPGVFDYDADQEPCFSWSNDINNMGADVVDLKYWLYTE